MLEINHAFKVHNIAGIQLLQFTLQVMLFIELKDMLSYYYYYSLLLLMYAVCEGLLVRNTAFVFCRMTLWDGTQRSSVECQDNWRVKDWRNVGMKLVSPEILIRRNRGNHRQPPLEQSNVHISHPKIVTEGKSEGKWRRESRRRQLLDDLQARRRYWNTKEEALDHTVWRTGCGRGCGPVVRETTLWWWWYRVRTGHL